ncbi:MAG: ribonuclease HI [Gammaproteobacteria bacterium]|nr:ribonuclease HI [Gammaproteobacteria bacterium]
MTTRVIIYTDGACRGNPGPGGWGALLRYGDHVRELCGAEVQTTNNRMELMGAIQALEALTRCSSIDLYTDSQYVIKGISEWLPAWIKRSWRTAGKAPVKNVDLWQRLHAATLNHDVRWHWVKGHSGVPDNEIVDGLANAAIDRMHNEASQLET